MTDSYAGSPAASCDWGSTVFILALFLLALLLLTFGAYYPGLAGPFLFDDFANLDALGNFGVIDNLEKARLFVLGGTSGPTGRPVALLSFLIDGNTWPADPWPFKRTNLVFHLLTGSCLFFLLKSLLSLDKSLTYRQAIIAAIVTAGIWLLHPLLVSTVLYAVQRMAIMSAFFIVLGLLGYIYGRIIFQYKRMQGYLWMSASLGICTVLATLSKENGVLLPLLALVLEKTWLSPRLDASPDRRWAMLFLWLPAMAPFGWFFDKLMDGSMVASFQHRSFSLTERLLTEPRILFNYLGWWFYPRVHSPGLLTQDFPLSHGLLVPPSTLLAIGGLITSLFFSFAYRNKYPLTCLAILFYFAGHILESGPVALELYFEHRNYLPVMFLALPLAVGLIRASKKIRILSILGPAIIIVLAILTFQRALIWGDLRSLSYSWANHHPNSQRAQRHAALVAEKRDSPATAIAILKQAQARLPDSLPIRLHLLMLQCKYSLANQKDFNEALTIAKKPYDFRTYKFLRSIVNFAPTEACRGISRNDIKRLLSVLKDNPVARTSRGAQRQILHLSGLLDLQESNGPAAYLYFRKAQEIYPDPSAGLLESAQLATAEFYAEALSLLELTELQLKRRRKDTINNMGNLDFQKEIISLREQIESDFQASRTQ